ncbi:hypothetical protein M3J09_010336 [Ascochyta lentis]
MTTSYRPSMDLRVENDAMSIRSTSTARSTTSLLRSLFRSQRTNPTKSSRYAETPGQKAERNLLKAEVRLAWAISR